MDALEDYGIRGKMTAIEPAEATVEQIAAIHRPEYIQKVADFAAAGGGYLDPDTAVSPRSYEAAVKAAGGVITAVDHVMAGEVDSAFALVRPPGHHAVAGRSMGFCLFNNIAAGTCHAREKYGLERILVVDWDVHHGNGTADTFYHDPGVLYFSTHQQGIFPGTGRISEVGAGPGEGYTVNIPFNRGTGNEGIYFAFTQLLEPIARQYRPELIMVSAGFDAHYSDPLAGLAMTVEGYIKIAEIVKNLADELCGGKLVAALEGGYNLGVVGHAVSAVVNVFGEYGITVDEPGGTPPGGVSPLMRMPVDEAIKVQKRYWDL